MSLRNTRTERICRTCSGTGAITVNDTNPFGYGPDPQCDEDVSCPECHGRGWIRWAVVDPLVVLGAERRGLVLQTGAHSMFRHSALAYYNRAKAKAMAPVKLPHARDALRWAA